VQVSHRARWRFVFEGLLIHILGEAVAACIEVSNNLNTEVLLTEWNRNEVEKLKEGEEDKKKTYRYD